jgi:hypothetical protein
LKSIFSPPGLLFPNLTPFSLLLKFPRKILTLTLQI